VSKRVKESIEVRAPLEEVYRYWSNFDNFSNVMENNEEVRMTGTDTSHWRVKGHLGKSVEFDAKTTEMDPGCGIRWHALNGGIMTVGEAHFEEVAPGRTRVDVTMNYADLLGGKVGEAAANVLSNPERNLREDLHNFARIVEGAKTGDDEAAIRLLDEWEAEECGYDEDTLPELKVALNREKPSYRKLFAG
jgi:uncharacterized membrane protein